MGKKEKKKKPVFEKVGIVFRNPVRADILKELSESPQRPKEIAENIGIQKQNLNYHLNALKKGGIVQTRREEFSESELPKGKGTRINGRSESGMIQAAYGVELTKNGKKIVNQFIDPLYEEEENSNDKKEDD
ncbi:MAG: winged helix-turn-helix domain-containing protein [Promethearchaeota archaeon]|jgi:DNA-binding transcriptional ArsR family regulator